MYDFQLQLAKINNWMWKNVSFDIVISVFCVADLSYEVNMLVG